jgi:hypothetical protein
MLATGTYTYDAAHLPRWNAEIPVAVEGKIQWFPVRPICLVLGIDSRTQVAILKGSDKYTGAWVEIPIKSPAGWRPTVCIRRDKVPQWFLDIDAARCALTARDELERFQTELLAEGERMLFGRKPSAPEQARGIVAYTARIEIQMACLDCGAPHFIVYENGEATVVRMHMEGEE